MLFVFTYLCILVSNTISKTVHRKEKIEHHEPHKKLGINLGVLEGLYLAVPAPHATPVRHCVNVDQHAELDFYSTSSTTVHG
jgi:Na+-transporting methylmalonyl-CoA/oxaloacetate decarboxylase gamma subunit